MQVEEDDYGTFRVCVYPLYGWKIFKLHDSMLYSSEIIEYVNQVLNPQIQLKFSVTIRDTNSIPLEKHAIESFLERALSISADESIGVTEAFHDTHLFIMAAPRDVARHYFLPESLPKPVDFTITIFDGSLEQEQRIAQYAESVRKYNDEVVNEPLEMVKPILLNDLVKSDRIVFIAQRAENEIIGFCACSVLPYSDLSGPLCTKSIGVGGFFKKGTSPGHSYEIEGLSVSKLESKKNVGLLLLREAMRFITSLSEYYPVNHIMARSASFVTKRLLKIHFDFVYYGTNSFLNESFVETLSEETRGVFLKCISDALAYYASLLCDTKQYTLIQRELKKRPLLMEMFKTVIHLYQLFFLFLKYTPRIIEISDTITTQLTTLFLDMATLLKGNRVNATLSIYFAENHANLLLYAKDRNLSNLQASIYTLSSSVESASTTFTKSMPCRIAMQFRQYGFLKEAALPREIKSIYTQGYDVLFMAVANVTMLARALGDLTDKTAELLFDPINEFLDADLSRWQDYELPYPLQLLVKPLPSALTLAIQGLDIPSRKKQIKRTLGKLNEKAIEVKYNDEDLRFLAYQNLGIPLLTNLPCDTLVSYVSLSENWSLNNERILSKVKQVPPPQTPITTLTRLNKTKRVYFLSLPMPENREALFSDIYVLRDIIGQGLSNETLISINHTSFSVGILKNHFIRLMGMRDTFLVEQEEEPNMRVEEGPQQLYYLLDDFIDEVDPLSDVFFNDNIMNSEKM